MQSRILLLLLVVGLVPLLLTAALFYRFARETIVADRVDIYLRHLSQQNADKIDLLLTERQEDLGPILRDESIQRLLTASDTSAGDDLLHLLNEYVRLHEVYDLALLVDARGRIRAANSLSRFGEWFDRRIWAETIGRPIDDYPEEAAGWAGVLENGDVVIHDSYRSKLVRDLYVYDDDDICRQYHLLIGRPIYHRVTGERLGAWLNVMSWEFFQAILDLVETDFGRLGLPSGYALLLDRTGRRILASPHRRNRHPGRWANQIGGDLLSQPELVDLHPALQADRRTVQFGGHPKRYAGISPIGNRELGWRVVVTLNEADIFRPVDRLGAAFLPLLAGAVALILTGAWGLSRHLGRPLAGLTRTAQEIAQGHTGHRAAEDGTTEVVLLARAFNDMAHTLATRQTELEQVNRGLEEMVRVRTADLEGRNAELQQAMKDLHDAQAHLVESAKMASLGQLIAGIAHEIKNPLNFIYGNTDFLSEYIDRLREWVERVENQLDPQQRADLQRHRQEANLDFVVGDLKRLAEEIGSGAARIKTIVDDLRTFARAASDATSEVDVRRVLDMCLNLLRIQYKDRIRITRRYEEIPMLSLRVGRVEQVFLNLLTNAIEAIPGEGEITVTTRRDRGRVVIEVADNGPGIPPELLDRLFEPFFTTKEVGQGTGLGLSISYGIVTQHGGTLTAHNRPEGGALFRVALPLVPPPPPPPEEPS